MSFRSTFALALSLATAFSAEAGWPRTRRSRTICGAAILTVAFATSDLWYPGNTPGNTPPPSAAPKSSRVFAFEKSEMVLFSGDWLDKQVADRLKAKLAKEHPTLAQSTNWKQNGVPVVLTSVSVEPDPTAPDRARIRLSGEFLELLSEGTISLDAFHRGESQKVSYLYHRDEEWKTSADLNFTLELRYESSSGSVEASVEGRFDVKGPLFTHGDEFSEGPWIATPPKRVASQ